MVQRRRSRWLTGAGDARAPAAAVLALLVAVLAGCGDGDDGAAPTGDAAAAIEVTSDTVDADGDIPVAHTCDGADTPPPLAWEGVPAGAAEVAVIVDDPDAPDGTFTHWLVAGLPGEDGRLDPGAGSVAGVQGQNDFQQRGWAGPCPPEGDAAHTYRFRVLALTEPSGLEPGFDAQAFAEAARGQVLAQGVLEATYGR